MTVMIVAGRDGRPAIAGLPSRKLCVPATRSVDVPIGHEAVVADRPHHDTKPDDPRRGVQFWTVLGHARDCSACADERREAELAAARAACPAELQAVLRHAHGAVPGLPSVYWTGRDPAQWRAAEAAAPAVLAAHAAIQDREQAKAAAWGRWHEMLPRSDNEAVEVEMIELRCRLDKIRRFLERRGVQYRLRDDGVVVRLGRFVETGTVLSPDERGYRSTGYHETTFTTSKGDAR